MKTNIRKESQRRLLRIHFFNDNENESDVIHETLIWQKVWFSSPKSIEQCPHEKGTSDEEEIWMKLDRVIVFVSVNENLPSDRVESLGRSYQLIINHHIR